MIKPLSILLLLGIITYTSIFTINPPRFLTNDLANPQSILETISDDQVSGIQNTQPVSGTCGCANVYGNCTCEDSSLSCNITFFDGTWGILPYGASVNYTGSPSPLTPPQTETYQCAIDYDPPYILPTIFGLSGICLVILLMLSCSIRMPFLREGSILSKVYRYGNIINTFWPAAHLAITMGYLYYLLDGQSFTPYITGVDGDSTSYISINTNWYINNPNGITLPNNFTGTGILQVNGQNCIVQETSKGDYSIGFMLPGYPVIIVFLLVSLLHIAHGIVNPSKMQNYMVYCVATGLNMLTAGWTWETWDTCYALLPEYSPDLFRVYEYLAYFEFGCLVLIIIISILFKSRRRSFILMIGMLMALGGFVFKILTYFQLAVRYYPKVVLILDAVYHSQFFLSCFFCIKSVIK